MDIVAVNSNFPTIKEFISIITTFSLTVFAWIFFRSEDIHQAIEYILRIFSPSTFSIPYFPGIGLKLPVFFFLILFIIMEWNGRKNLYAIQFPIFLKSPVKRRFGYIALLLVIYYYTASTDTNQFIYFQF